MIRTTRGIIGLTLAQGKQGEIYAAEVIPDEPAAKDGGLKRGDIILEVCTLISILDLVANLCLISIDFSLFRLTERGWMILISSSLRHVWNALDQW